MRAEPLRGCASKRRRSPEDAAVRSNQIDDRRVQDTDPTDAELNSPMAQIQAASRRSMEAPNLERKLVAILAADVEGFSRHMERDEPATLAILSHHRSVIDAMIGEHGGRITGTAGDSILA